MTSLLALSHSRKVALAVQDLVLELNPDISVFAVGGTKDGSAGADFDGMQAAIREALKLGSVIVLFDLGSTLMTIQMVLDELSESDRSKVFLSDAALVEGAIVASVSLGADVPMEEIVSELQKLSLKKME